MPEFHRVSFDREELDAVRHGCGVRSAHEDRMLDEAAGGSLEAAIVQESRADDMLLIKGTVALFKPGQTILITGEDLRMIRSCLDDDESEGAKSAVKKIDSSLASGAERQ